MEGEKIFFKNLNEFATDNNINKNIFYKKKDRFENLYGIKIEELKKDSREKIAGHTRNKDYHINKIYEPIIALMFNVFQNNKIKTKFSDLKYIPLNKFLDYIESNINEINKLPSDIYIEVVDNPTYEYNYTTNEYMRIFLEKIETITNTILSFDMTVKENTLCDIITKLNDIIDLLNESQNKEFDFSQICYENTTQNLLPPNDYKNTIQRDFTPKYYKNITQIYFTQKYYKNITQIYFTQKHCRYIMQNPLPQKYYEDIIQNPLLDEILKDEFSRLNNLFKDIHSEFKTDIRNKPSIYNIRENTAKKEPFYDLSQNSEREDIFSILKNTSPVFEDLITSLEPEIDMDYLLYSKGIENYNLLDFISIYKLDAYNKLKNLNLEYIDSNYFKILEKLSNNIDLAKKYIFRKIFYSNKMTSSEFLIFNHKIDYLYKTIVAPEEIKHSQYIYEILTTKEYTDNILFSKLDKIPEKKIIKEIKTKNDPNSFTYKIDAFLQLYTNNDILNLILNYIKFNKSTELEYNHIIDLSSNTNISLDRLSKNKTDLGQ